MNECEKSYHSALLKTIKAGELPQSFAEKLSKSRLRHTSEQAPAPQLQAMSRDDIRIGLEKAVGAGALPANILSQFDSRPWEAIARIPFDVARRFGLPTVDKEKSLSRAEVAARLERAAAGGKIPWAVLTRFDSAPEAALASVPEEVCKSFGIPRLAPRSLPKVPLYDAPWWEILEYQSAMNR